ncbi:protein B4 [Grus americana]|uniref:protein B4 n=1 Tax=Grus americana TaxID=9117 RepID=UPI002407A6C4|nr:protein B4 [Grus americana]
MAAWLLGNFAALGGVGASGLGAGTKRCLLPLPAAEAAGTAQLPGLPARGRRPPHPPTLHMVIEALRAQDQRKGVSVIAIKRFILAKYPAVDPVRLKYLLKQALSKGLSRGDLVRPHNSSATGATGRFKLAPEKLRHKLGRADPDGGQAPKLGPKGTTKPPPGPCLGSSTALSTTGAAEEKLTAAKQKPRAKPVDAQPPAAVKPRNDGAKPPRAASRPRAPGKGRSGSATAPAAEDAGGGDGDNPVGAGAKGPQKAPVGKSKGKAPKRAQQDAPKAKGGQGKARKPKVTPGAGQGEARPQNAALVPAGRKAL